MKLQVLNNSEYSDYLKCPELHYYAHIERLVPRDAPPDYLGWGQLYHEGIKELWCGSWDPDDAVQELADKWLRGLRDNPDVSDDFFAARAESLEEMLPDVCWAVSHYAQNRQDKLSRCVPVLVEKKLEVPIALGVGFFGTPDVAYYDPEVGDIAIDDHKTTGVGVDTFESKLQLDTQAPGYVFALREAIRLGLLELPSVAQGAEVSGRFTWDVIRRKQPSLPKVLKVKKTKKSTPNELQLWQQQEASGLPQGLVSSQLVDTLPEIYEGALKKQVEERGLLVTAPQEERLRQLQEKGDTFLASTEHIVRDDQIERWQREFLTVAGRIRDQRENPYLRYRNRLACSLSGSPKCAYRWVCVNPETRDQMYERKADEQTEVGQHEGRTGGEAEIG